MKMRQGINWNRSAQFGMVLLCALGLKLFYSSASPNQLRWILAPTTLFVEQVTGRQFEFESHAGYLSSDRSFLIAASCAGVNFLVTSFLMLSLRKLWRNRSQHLGWGFIPASALCAYLGTLVANTVRISFALQLQGLPLGFGWLNPNEIHRFEGIFIYFGFLLLLYAVSEKMSSENPSGLLRLSLFPLLTYYATMLGIPLVNGAYRSGFATNDFWDHLLFVLLTPLLVILPLAAIRLWRSFSAPLLRATALLYSAISGLADLSSTGPGATPKRLPLAILCRAFSASFILRWLLIRRVQNQTRRQVVATR